MKHFSVKLKISDKDNLHPLCMTTPLERERVKKFLKEHNYPEDYYFEIFPTGVASKIVIVSGNYREDITDYDSW